MDRKCFDILPNYMVPKALVPISDVRTDSELPLLGYCYHGLKERLQCGSDMVIVRWWGDECARRGDGYWYSTAYPVCAGEFLMLITPRPNGNAT